MSYNCVQTNDYKLVQFFKNKMKHRKYNYGYNQLQINQISTLYNL